MSALRNISDRTTFSSWGFALVVIACAMIVAGRSPELIVAPRLVMEDGAIFFAQAYNLPPLDALLKTYAGYWHLLPRLVAEAGMWLPLRSVPLFYSLVSLGVTSVSISWFYLPHFRRVVASDWLRLAFVALVACMPGLDGLLLLAYVQWYLALWGVLFVLMEPPQRLSVQWILAAVYLIALGTAPALHLLLPIWIWRLFTAKREQRPWLLLIVMGNLGMLLLTLFGPVKSSLALGDPTVVLLDMARGVAFRVVTTPLLGYPVAQEILRQWGWRPLLGLTAVVLLSVAGSLLRLDRSRRPDALIVLYTAATACVLYLIRSQAYGTPFLNPDNQVELISVRYFLLSIVALYLLLLMLADQWLAADGNRAGWLFALLLIVLLLYSPTYRWTEWRHANWPHYAWLIDHVVAQESVKRSPDDSKLPGDGAIGDATPVVIDIPLSPPGWKMHLALASGKPQGWLFPEGLRLLGVRAELQGSLVQVDLDWSADAAGNVLRPYTAYVHLLGTDGTRVGGSDVVALDGKGQTEPRAVWSTHHEFVLESALAAGDDYDLAVGLYRWEEGQINPHAVVLPRWLHAP